MTISPESLDFGDIFCGGIWGEDPRRGSSPFCAVKQRKIPPLLRFLCRRISPSADGDKGCAPLTAVAFLYKSDETTTILMYRR